MHILILCYEYPPLGGGGGVGAKQYAEAWSDQGHTVTVLTSGDESLPSRAVEGGVEVIRVRAPWRRDRATSSLLSMGAYNLLALLYLLWYRDEFEQVDVVNTHFSIPTGPVGWLAGRWLDVPNVLTIIGGDIYDPSKRLSPHRSRVLSALNRSIIGAADRVIAISSDTRRRARTHYGISRPIRVVNYGYAPLDGEADGPPSIDLDSDIYYLIAVGRLVERKGFDVLIRAMRKLPDSIHLVLVGDGPLESELTALAEGAGVEDRVHMLGYQSRAGVHGLLQRSDCFVLSSHHEGLGIVVQEAMDAGLPVVATNEGGQVDLIRDGRNGLLVPPGDERALAEAVEHVYRNPARAEAMGRHNLEDIRELYVDRNCRLYLEEFRDVIAEDPTETVRATHGTQDFRTQG